MAEPLRVEAQHFIECIRNGAEPLTGIKHARNVVSVLERAGSANGKVIRPFAMAV
jgi:predicted dehydrogenase